VSAENNLPENPFKTSGFAAAEFTFAQPNGVLTRAPLEFWVAAILTVLTDAQRIAVLERVEKISSNQLEVQSTDGFPVRVSSLGG
jgi:hypothetical protein